MNLLVIAYVLGYAAMFPRIFKFFLDDFSMGKPHRDDVFTALYLGVLVTPFWPLVVIGLILKAVILDPLSDRVIKEYEENK